MKFAAKVNGCETAAKGGAKRNVTQAAAAALPAPVSTLFCWWCCSMLPFWLALLLLIRMHVPMLVLQSWLA